MSKALMSKAKGQVPKRSLMKGMLAGLVGGLAAVVVKSAAEKFFAARTHGEAQTHTALAERFPEKMGRLLTAGEELAAAEAIHWGIGAGAGAVYGGVAEYFPAATAKDGASFGLTLATVSSRLAGAAEGQTTIDKTSGMAAHLVYGVVTETVRRFVRKRLG
jgi:putative membrane protein